MDATELRVPTGRDLVTDLTAEIRRFCAGRREPDGLCHVFAPHATAGVALIETGSGSEEDLRAALERLVPRGEDYVHRHGSAGHGADHVVPVFVSPSLVLAVRDNELVLGTWQSVVLVDPNVDNPDRRVLVHFVAA